MWRTQGHGRSCWVITATERLKAFYWYCLHDCALTRPPCVGSLINLWPSSTGRIRCSGIGRLDSPRCHNKCIAHRCGPRAASWAFSPARIGDGCKSDAHVVQVSSIPWPTNRRQLPRANDKPLRAMICQGEGTPPFAPVCECHSHPSGANTRLVFSDPTHRVGRQGSRR